MAELELRATASEQEAFRTGRMVLHRWEHDGVLGEWVCIPPPAHLPTGDRCPGCGIRVDDRDLAWFTGEKPASTILSAALNTLALIGRFHRG